MLEIKEKTKEEEEEVSIIKECIRSQSKKLHLLMKSLSAL